MFNKNREKKIRTKKNCGPPPHRFRRRRVCDAERNCASERERKQECRGGGIVVR
jgi:hypothetical protein